MKLMKFIASGPKESMADFEDDYVARLQKSVRRIKSSREMGERYMLFEEMLKEERAEGKAEGISLSILSILETYGDIPEELREEIMSVESADVLEKLLKSAIQVKSVSEFRSVTGL